MIVTTTHYVEGYDIVDYLGTVRSFRECDDVEVGMDDLESDLIDQAEEMGAEAIVGLTFTSASTYTQYCDGEEKYPDMIAYGTAVRIEPED